MRRLVLLLVPMILAPGCARETPAAPSVVVQSEPRFDCTTDRTTEVSSHAAMDGLKDEERAEFKRSLETILHPHLTLVMERAKSGDPDQLSVHNFMAPLHGLTVREINAKAKAARERASVSPKPESLPALIPSPR